MKPVMIDMMNAMMPLMRPLTYAAMAALLSAVVLGVMGLSRLAFLLGGIIAVIGLFFIVCEGAGRFLGFEPTILFADPANRALYRNQWPFWTLGLAFAVAGWIVRRALRGAAAR